MTTMEKQTYNGWTNYETWNVKLWIDNDQGEQEHWHERAKVILEESEADTRYTNKENAIFQLKDELKSVYDDNMEDLGIPHLEGFYADLLNAALSEVNWYEIAEAIIKDLEEV